MKKNTEKKEKGILPAIFLMIVMLLMAGITEQEQTLQKHLAQRLLRLRIIAGSDSVLDQEQKLKVRDAVTSLLNPYMEECKSRDETRQIVQNMQMEIVRTAETAAGTSDIQVDLRQEWFPVRTWGSYTIPEGNYETLRIQIGEGKGHNWWTVLYPGIYLSEAVHPVFTGQEGENLKQILGEDVCDFIRYPAKTRIRFLWLR